MDVYTATRLYKKVLVHWWEEADEEQKEAVRVRVTDIPIESIFILLFRMHPVTKILLIASDGCIQTIQHMDDPTPASFRNKRFMKIDNKTSISSVKNVTNVLYQLLSITVDTSGEISILDWIGLVQFFLLLHTEQFINVSTCDLFIYFQRSLFICNEGIKGIEETRWKELRNRVLSNFYESTSNQGKSDEREELPSSESMYFIMYESLLEKMCAIYPIIQKLSMTIDLQNEEIERVDSRVNHLISLLVQQEDEK